MAIEFKLPELGENIAGGDVTRVLVKVGDAIKAEQAVIEMETGKATVEIPSSVAGVVTAIHVKEGSKAKVGQAILTVDADAAPAAKPAAPAKAAKAAAPAPAPAPAAAPAAPAPSPAPFRPAPAYVPPVVEVGGKSTIPAAPSTRKFAREIGVDITAVPGSGPGGRVSEDDVKSFSRALHQGGVPGAGRPVAPALPDFGRWGEFERQGLSTIRVITAEHMANSWSNIPHVTLHDKADITELEKLRKQQKAKSPGSKLTVTAFLVKIAASALKVFPNFNASLDLGRQELILKKFINIGVAVDTEKGLMVPVIRNADQRNVTQLGADLTALAEKARAKKISPDDLQGGCFTITNLGGIGGTFFTPIVNLPEVAILGVGRSAYEPVLVDGFFQPRLMMPLSLSFDHRVIDGADGARFMKWVVDAIQQPAMLSLEG